MSVFKRPGKKRDGYAYEFQRGGIRYTRSGFETATSARDAEIVHKATLTDQRLAREYGIRPPRGRVPTVRKFLTEIFLPSQRGHLAPGTYQRTMRILNRLVDWLSPCSLLDVTRAKLDAYRIKRDADLAANSVRAEWAKIRRFFGVAVEQGHLTVNPARAVELPRETRGPDRILTDAEQGRLLAAFWSSVMRDMAEFSLWTGLRPGELCGLLGRYADLAGARLYLPQPKVEQPKVIPLMPEAVAILLRQPTLMDNGPVFHGVRPGRGVSPIAYRRAFRKAVIKSGIAPIRPNDCRHTMAVRLIQAGADLATVGDLLGHKPPYRTTGRYLAHTSEERKREVLSRLRGPAKSPARKTAKSARLVKSRH